MMAPPIAMVSFGVPNSALDGKQDHLTGCGSISGTKDWFWPSFQASAREQGDILGDLLSRLALEEETYLTVGCCVENAVITLGVDIERSDRRRRSPTTNGSCRYFAVGETRPAATCRG